MGDNPAKGLSVFTKKGIRARICDWYDPTFRFVIPVDVETRSERFTLVAVWAQAEKPPSKGYAAQVWAALQAYENRMGTSSIWAGDFNSSVIFDVLGAVHQQIVTGFTNKGFTSFYHSLRREPQGEERRATFFLQKKRYKPYHLDYVFAHKRRLDGASLRVGQPLKWLAHSDHMPILTRITPPAP